MRIVLALDAGTSGVRTVAFDDTLSVLATAHRELTQHYPAPGLVEHDAAEITALARETLSEVAGAMLAAGHEIVACGITNQRETTIAFDRANGRLGHHAIVWQDRRTATRCASLIDDGHSDLIRARTGLVIDSYFSATKMQWLIEHGALDHMTSPSLCTVDAYLVWSLTGEYVTEPSNASRTMILDISSRAWSNELASLFSVPLDTLPIVQPSIGAFGTVRADVVPELAGVPITAVLGDQQSALFGQACFTPGTVKATYGTGAFILANAGAAVPPAPAGLVATVAWDLGRFGDSTYALEGSSFVAGAAIQWLRDELGLISAASELGPLAASVPDAGGVSFVPAFTGLGSPFWRSDARGALVGLTRGSTRAHIARAVRDAQAFQVRAMTDAFVDAGVRLSEIRADGGAAAMDEMLALQANLSKSPVARSRTLEATALGAAAAAGLGAGLFASIEQIAQRWTRDALFTPVEDPAAEAAYVQWLRAVQRA